MEMARAEIALRSGDLDAAAEWASNAIASAVRARRHKDESSSRALLGRVLLAERRAEEAIGEIRTAVAIADELGVRQADGRAEPRSARLCSRRVMTTAPPSPTTRPATSSDPWQPPFHSNTEKRSSKHSRFRKL
jgi:hypothetical protein